MPRLTFDRLFQVSDPKRVTRSFDVKGPPLDIDAYRDSVYYAFNFKSHITNTTGLRHRGYVKFFRPRSNVPTPLQHLPCIVDCTCPDYRYRWAWANKQRGSGVVGPRSMNQSLNRAPRITNPQARPGLCKHILAVRDYIYGLLSRFEGDEPDTSYKLDKLLKYASKRWADFPGQMAAAREREALFRRNAQRRNVAGPPPVPAPEPAAPAEVPGEAPELPPEVELPVPPVPQQPQAQPPLAVPPEERRRQREWPGQPPVPSLPAGPQKAKSRVATGGYDTEAERRFNRYGESANVVIANSGPDMNDLQNAIKLVEELADETEQMITLDAPDAVGDDAISGAVASPDLPPSEPPISDTALGADTEGETALSLLSQMRDSLQQLAQALAPAPELEPGAEGGAGPGAGGALPAEISGGEDDLGVPDLADDAFGAEEGAGGEGESEAEGGEEGGEEAEDDDEEDEGSNRRPVGEE
jgi:hypothetical protein